MEKIKKMLKENKVIPIIILIFILFVAYKFISSNIQENKEKAVIDYRIKSEQNQNNLELKSQKDELTSCLNIAKDKSVKDSAFIFILAQCWGVGTLDNGSQDECVANKGMGRQICQLQSGVCTDQISIKLKEIKDTLSKDEDNCYKRYN